MDLQHTAELLGNFGEFVGAIAVVVTLVYLAVQVRQNKQSLDANMRLQKLSMRQRITEDSSSLTKLQASSSILNSALTKLIRTGERLTETELVAYSSFMSALFRTWEGVHYQYRNGLMDESEWRAEANGYASFFRFKLTWAVWNEIQDHYSDEFKEMIRTSYSTQ